MKILLIGDASNCHWNLAQGLRNQGHDVTVASHGSRWMNTNRNIDLYRHPGKLGGALLWLKLNTVLPSQLRGFDIVQISNPIFLELKPNRNRVVFDRLKKYNGRIFLSNLAADSEYVRHCRQPILRYNEWYVNGKPAPYAIEHPERQKEWEGSLLHDHTRYIYDNVDGVLSVLYEYYLTCSQFLPKDKLGYMGIPIDTSNINPAPLSIDGPVRIMVACHKGRETEKGINQILPVLQQLNDSNLGKIKLDIVQNVPFHQFQDLLNQAHIIVDQLYSYTPATTALMAMARGKVVISGGEPEYYDFIGETNLNPKPIINPIPNQLNILYQQLQTLIDNHHLLAQMGALGPDFVKKHNSLDVVAKRVLDFWESHS